MPGVEPSTRLAGLRTGDFVEKPKRRTITSPGLGESGLRVRYVMPNTAPDSGMPDRAPSSERERESEAPASAEKISTRRARTRRPVRVDDVGDVAVAIASRAMPSFAPKLLKSRVELSRAPIDARDAFVLSLIDGKTSVAQIVDASGMAPAQVAAILDRMVQLGIVALP